MDGNVQMKRYKSRKIDILDDGAPNIFLDSEAERALFGDKADVDKYARVEAAATEEVNFPFILKISNYSHLNDLNSVFWKILTASFKRSATIAKQTRTALMKMVNYGLIFL